MRAPRLRRSCSLLYAKQSAQAVVDAGEVFAGGIWVEAVVHRPGFIGME